MADNQEDAPLARGSVSGSHEVLVNAGPRGGSNSRAAKVAALTTLACLLLASQVFTAYMLFDQKQQIHTLQKTSERMGKLMTRTSQVAAPARMAMPMNSLPLQMDFTEEDSKTEKAQQNPGGSTPQPASLIQTKCQTEAAPGVGKIGAYKPQCDEQGRYKPMQCWHATGFCWCVDQAGNPIQGTTVRGRPDCNRGTGFRRMMVAPRMMQKTYTEEELAN
ncbi:CD74 molecule, major histocompatibility complex, class II invariant chain a [Cyprinodon tularosa]|uniref:CD74 molecule, major histocompatibility complex, class II invariant chain a n=1 Tax=Cyprinodon tularosa TaxID=77115 RepID=UPI0018E280EC|nr:CD74 molecule, major histocompatibility complex, class II invariant chain a [Cyprinodon tularosa]